MNSLHFQIHRTLVDKTKYNPLLSIQLNHLILIRKANIGRANRQCDKRKNCELEKPKPAILKLKGCLI